MWSALLEGISRREVEKYRNWCSRHIGSFKLISMTAAGRWVRTMTQPGNTISEGARSEKWFLMRKEPNTGKNAVCSSSGCGIQAGGCGPFRDPFARK